MERTSTNDRPGTLVTEFNEFDVTLGRGKNANNRPGNIRFRRIAAEMAGAYKVADSIARSRIANEFISKIHGKGGRFLQSVTAANSQGRVVTLWEVVHEEKTLTKVKQALRDAGSERPIRRSAPKQRSPVDLESPRQRSGEAAAMGGAGNEHGTGPIGFSLPTPHPLIPPPQEQHQQIERSTPIHLQLLAQQRLLAQLQHDQQVLQLRAAAANSPPASSMMYALHQQPYPLPPSIRGASTILPPGADPHQQIPTNTTFPLLLQQLHQQPQQASDFPPREHQRQQQLSDLLLQQSLLRGDIHLPLIPAAPQQQLEPLGADELILRASNSRLQQEERLPTNSSLSQPESTASLKRSASDAELAVEHSFSSDIEDMRRVVPAVEHQQQHHRPSESVTYDSALPGGLMMSGAFGLQQLPSASPPLFPTVVAAPMPPTTLGEQQQQDSSPESLTSSGVTSLLAAVVAARGPSSRPGESSSASDDGADTNKASSSSSEGSASKGDESAAAATATATSDGHNKVG